MLAGEDTSSVSVAEPYLLLLRFFASFSFFLYLPHLELPAWYFSAVDVSSSVFLSLMISVVASLFFLL